MNNDEKNNYNNQGELAENSSQTTENKSTGQKLSESAVKGAATAAGGIIAGKAGAAIGSKAADAFNNYALGNRVNNTLENAVPGLKKGPNKTFPNETTSPTNQGQNVSQNQPLETNQSQPINQSPEKKTPSSLSDASTSKPKQNDKQKSFVPKSTYNNNAVPNSTINKNPSKNKYDETSKRHSKHADGFNDNLDNTGDEKEKSTPSKKGLFPSKNKNLDNEESTSENYPEEAEKNSKSFGNILKLAVGLISGIFGTLGAIGAFIITHIVLISIIIIIALTLIFISTIIAFITSFLQYGKEDDGTVCYVTPSCNQVVIKSENGDKTYSMDEYIAGAIVNYYDHDSYAVADADVDQNLLKAFSVIIHSDIAAYSDYTLSSETCTLTESSRFSDIYVPTTANDTTNNTESSDDSASNSNSNQVDAVSGADTNQTAPTEEQLKEEENQKKNKYYNQAKSAADDVITEVVDVYTQKLNIFYDGYKSILNVSSVTGSDYKQIIRDYIKGSPDYEEIASDDVSNATDDTTASEDDSTKDDNDGEAIGIYPVCSYQENDNNNDNSGSGIVTIAGDFCTQIEIMNGSNAGIYSYDKFIEGVLYNEAGAWSNSLDTMKAHAVAARTWLYNAIKTNFEGFYKDGDTCHVYIKGKTLGFKNATNSAIHQAVSETSGEYIVINGEISSEGRWDALAIKDGYYQNKDSEYFILKQKDQKIPKDWLYKQTLYYTIPEYITYSHGAGMSQFGAYYLATVDGKNYKEIINYYYGADIGKASKGYVMPINTFTMITGEKSIGYCKSRDVHTGTDFAAPAGTPVYAATSGVIEKEYSFAYRCYYEDDAHYSDCLKSNPNAGDNRAGQGFKIKNDDGTYSVYFHFSKKENLHKGDRVTAGQKIGEVGTTGLSSGPHLHYEMRLTSVGNSVDPRNYLPMEGYSICYNNPYYKP